MSDAATIGQIIGSIFVGAGGTAGVIAGWLRYQRTSNASADADVAHSRAERAAAQADEKTYNRLIERIEQNEGDIRRMSHELSAMRRQIRHAEDHISVLQRAMRDAGISFTPYEPLRLDPAP